MIKISTKILEKLEKLPDNLEGKTVKELQAIGGELTQVKTLIRQVIQEFQSEVQTALEVATIAEGIVRNADPEFAALAQAGNVPDRINERLDGRRYLLEKRIGKEQANKRIESVIKAIKGASK